MPAGSLEQHRTVVANSAVAWLGSAAHAPP
jgi:hypothetical protein